MKLTNKEVAVIENWVSYIKNNHTFTREQRDVSYQQWAKGSTGWDCIQQGGTGIMLLLVYYHHVFRVGSKEWRPKIIITDLLTETNHLNRLYENKN